MAATFLVIYLSWKWCILKHFANALRKKQLYRQEMPEWRSKQ